MPAKKRQVTGITGIRLITGNRWITGGGPSVNLRIGSWRPETQQIAGAYVFIRGGAVSAQVNHTAPTMAASDAARVGPGASDGTEPVGKRDPLP